MMPMEEEPVDLGQDIRTNRSKEETNRVGVRLEEINSAMEMIGLIREAVWEVQILKLWVKEESMPILIKIKEVNLTPKVLRELMMILLGEEIVGVDLTDGKMENSGDLNKCILIILFLILIY